MSRHDPVMRFLGVPGDSDELDLLGLDPSRCTPVAIDAALVSKLAMVYDHPQGRTQEGEDLRRRLRMAADHLKDPESRPVILMNHGSMPAPRAPQAMRAVSKPADGVTLVNGIARPVLHRDGRPAFGEDYVKAGVLGRIIHEPSVASVRQARTIVDAENLGLALAAVGGVSRSEDLADFFEAGADAIMLGSAPMYLPDLACEIKRAHPDW